MWNYSHPNKLIWLLLIEQQRCAFFCYHFIEKSTLIFFDMVQQLRSIATRENRPDAALRIAVESGGCHGYQYKMELAKEALPDD